jgi:hypothetical protein
MFYKKTIFYSKQNCQNRLKGECVFANQLLRQNIPQPKSNQPNKTLVHDPKQNQSG